MFLGAIYKCSFNHKLWCTLGLIRFNLFINDLPLHAKNISVDCDMLTDDTTLRTFGFFLFGFFYRKKYARQFRSGNQLVRHNHIIWSSFRSRPSQLQSLPDRNTSCHPYRSITFHTGRKLIKCQNTVF